MKLLHFFLVTLMIGSLTFGGGYAIISVLKGELVDKQGWVSAKDFGYAIAVGQLTPGPISTSVAFLGLKIAGLPGAILGTLGIYLPAFLAVLIVSKLYNKLHSHPRVQGALSILYPAVGALLASVAVDFGKEIRGAGWLSYAVGFVSFVLMSFTSLSPGWLLGGCIVLGALVH